TGFSVLFGNQNGGFSTPLAVRTGSATAAIAVADFDGDGRADVAYVNGDAPEVYVQRGDGLGSFGAAQRFAVGARAHGVIAVDVNDDKQPDLVVGTSAGVSVLVSDGRGGFAAAHDVDAGLPGRR